MVSHENAEEKSRVAFEPRGPLISGLLRHAITGQPAGGGFVSLERYDSTSREFLGTTSSGSDGHYSFYPLGGGSYRVCAGGGGSEFSISCFDGVVIHRASDFAASTPVIIGDDEIRDGIDIQIGSGGKIRGTVRNSRTGMPHVPTGLRLGLTLNLYDEMGVLVDTGDVHVNDDGIYELAGVPDGSFYVTASPYSGILGGTQLYPGVNCPADICSFPNGQRIVVSNAAALDGIDFSFAPQATVAGTVTDRTSGAPIGGIRVRACPNVVPWPVCHTSLPTEDDGRYIIDLPPQRYRLIAYASDSHVDQIYPDLPCVDCESHFIAVSTYTTVLELGDHIQGRDFSLARSTRISGTVSNALTGQPSSGVDVGVFDADYRFLWRGATTSEAGTYTTRKWPSGTYYVAAYKPWLTYCSFHLDRPCPPNRSDPAAIAAVNPVPVVVGDGELRTGIDIRMPHVELIHVDGFEGSD